MQDDINLLLVDDDEVDRELIRRGLVASGVTGLIRSAIDGRQALAVLNGTDGQAVIPRPCIILTDLNMPRMNGHELLRAIKSDPTLDNCAVFVLSTTTDPNEIQSCYDDGATGFMTKETIVQDFSLLVDFLRIYERLVTFPTG